MTEKLSVMILDDEPIVGKRLKPALEKNGCEVSVFVNPKDAVEALEKRSFDIVVTDIRMDEIDGMQILELVMKRYPETKVIMITGYAMMSLAREAMANGAFDFISKPFKPDDLRRVIAKAAKDLGASIDFDAQIVG